MKLRFQHSDINLAKTVMAVIWLLTASHAWGTDLALLIGIGQYENAKVNKLAGPVNDVRSMNDALVKRLGFSSENIVTLLDSQATKKAILAALDQLEARSKAGDFILIYFSGHGTSYYDADFGVYASLPYASGAWLPFDTETDPKKGIANSILVGRRDLRPVLENLDHKGRRVLVLSDSCFSGQLVRGLGGSDSKFVALPGAYDPLEASSELGNRKDPPPYPYQHVMMLSAANENEPAKDINANTIGKWPTIDGKPHGSFTDALLRVLNGDLGTTLSAGGTTSIASVHRAVDNFMNTRSYGHSAQMLPAIRDDEAGLLTQPWPGLKGVALEQKNTSTTSVELTINNTSLREQLNGLGGVKLVKAGSDLRIAGDRQTLKLIDQSGETVNETDDPKVLLKRLEAEVWLRNQIPAGQGDFTLLASLDPDVRGGNYVRCETLAINLKANRAVYLFVIDLASDGMFNVLYPSTPGELHATGANTMVAIPGSHYQDRIQVVPPFGIDEMYVFSFAEKPDFLESMVSQHFLANQPQAKTLAAGLKAAANQMQYQRLILRTSANPLLTEKTPCPTSN